MKDDKTLLCQGLEDPLAAAGSRVPTKRRRVVGQDWGWVSALTLKRQDHPNPQRQGLIPSSALLPKQGSWQTRDPFAGWKVPVCRDASLHRPSVPRVFAILERAHHFPDSPRCDLPASGFCWVMFLSGGFALPSVVRVQLRRLQVLSCATLLWNPLVFCRVISAEDESSFCVNGSGDDTCGNLCFLPFTQTVWAWRVNWIKEKKKKKGLKTYACVWTVLKLHSSMWEGVSDPAGAEVHLWVCSDGLFSDQCVFQMCSGLEKQINHLYYSTVNWVSFLRCPKESEPCSSVQQFIVNHSFCYNPFIVPPFFGSLLASICKGWYQSLVGRGPLPYFSASPPAGTGTGTAKSFVIFKMMRLGMLQLIYK